jgi:hypothetical protein
MASKYMKKCSISLVLKEKQIKTTLRFHLTLVRMARTKEVTTKNSSPYTLLVGMQVSTTTMEINMEIPQKVKDRTAI